MPSRYSAVITLSAAPVASNGWDLSSELTIKTTSGALNVEPTSKASVSADKNGLSISATSCYVFLSHRAEALAHPAHGEDLRRSRS
jgi:hypothetical protein